MDQYVEQQLILTQFLHHDIPSLQNYLLTRHCPAYHSAIIQHLLQKSPLQPRNCSWFTPASPYKDYLLNQAKSLIIRQVAKTLQFGQIEHDIYSRSAARTRVRMRVGGVEGLVVDLGEDIKIKCRERSRAGIRLIQGKRPVSQKNNSDRKTSLQISTNTNPQKPSPRKYSSHYKSLLHYHKHDHPNYNPKKQKQFKKVSVIPKPRIQPPTNSIYYD